MPEEENLVEKDVNNETPEVEETSYPHPSLQKVEDERMLFWNSYKKHNFIKTLVFILCCVVVIVCCIVFPNIEGLDNTLRTGLTFGVMILGLGGALAYSTYVRRKFERKMREYFNLFFTSVNDFVFEDKNYKDVELQTPGKITLDEFNECKLYKDVVEAGSRGLTTFKYKNIDMSIVDCAGNVKKEKRMMPTFVGKMLRSKASYKGDKPIVVYLKGNDRSLPPTNLDDLKNVFEDKKMVVYSNYKDWQKVLSGPVMKAIEAIKVNNLLVDVAICLYEEKAFIMLGYDDPIMVLPLQNTFNSKPTESYKSDMSKIVKLVEVLNK